MGFAGEKRPSGMSLTCFQGEDGRGVEKRRDVDQLGSGCLTGLAVPTSPERKSERRVVTNRAHDVWRDLIETAAITSSGKCQDGLWHSDTNAL